MINNVEFLVGICINRKSLILFKLGLCICIFYIIFRIKLNNFDEIYSNFILSN